MDPTLDRCAQLRAHKVLPRRRIVSEINFERARATEKSRRTSEPSKKDEEITSWMASTSPTTSNPGQHLPLTPPPLPHDKSDVSLFSPSPQDRRTKPQATCATERSVTPVNQNTPPTPELTPPREPTRKPHDVLLDGIRFPSSASQADSFKTAQEYAASENGTAYRLTPENDQLFGLPSIGDGNQGSLNTLQNLKAVGLGLGLNLDERQSSSTMRTLRSLHSPTAMETPAHVTEPTVSDDPFTITEPAAVREVSLTQLNHVSPIEPESAKSQPVRRDSFQSSLDRAFKLRDRIDEARQDEKERPNPYPEEDVEFIASSHKSKQPSPESFPGEGKRISQLSAGSSAVVEAMVIETPKRQRQKLRHSGKNASLRDAGSPISGSNRSSLISNEAKPRLQHKIILPLTSRNRTSLNSDSGISMGLETNSKDPINAQVELPKRRSSLKSATKDKAAVHAASLDPKSTIASRPATAPDGATSEVIMTSPRLRSASDLGPQNQKECRGRELRRSKPTVPARTSSLSAPTSRNQSRATSLGSDRHLKLGEQKQLESPQYRDSALSRNVPEISIEGDDFNANDNHRTVQLRPSLTRTPFSAVSATSFQSSTPGPVELNEATAITIYPHNNKSLLVVQHSNNQGLDKTTTSTHLTNNVTVKLRQSSKTNSPLNSEVLALPEIDSNPHAAPPRPAVMLIPPTPANALHAEGNVVNSNAQRSKRTISRPLSSIKRAFSTRRHSDATISPLSRFISQSSEIPLRRRIKIDSASNALSPFWRPRGFWDDFSDGESDSEEEIGYVRNTLGLPQKQVIAGPVALARRLGSLKRRKETSTLSNLNSTARHMSLPSLRFGNRDGTEATNATLMSRLRQPFDLNNPFSRFYEILLRKRTERDDAKLERERDRLKRSIGPVLPRTYNLAYR